MRSNKSDGHSLDGEQLQSCIRVCSSDMCFLLPPQFAWDSSKLEFFLLDQEENKMCLLINTAKIVPLSFHSTGFRVSLAFAVLLMPSLVECGQLDTTWSKSILNYWAINQAAVWCIGSENSTSVTSSTDTVMTAQFHATVCYRHTSSLWHTTGWGP